MTPLEQAAASSPEHVGGEVGEFVTNLIIDNARMRAAIRQTIPVIRATADLVGPFVGFEHADRLTAAANDLTGSIDDYDPPADLTVLTEEDPT